jgi:hypothetical protein
MPKLGGVPENLIEFQPGQSGNPKGRPKGSKNISTYLRMLNDAENAEDVPEGKLRELVKLLREKGYDNGAATLAHTKYSIALNKDVKPEVRLKAIDSIEDRLEGKATQKTELTGKDGGALSLQDVNASFEASLQGMTKEELAEYRKCMETAEKIAQNAKERSQVVTEVVAVTETIVLPEKMEPK